MGLGVPFIAAIPGRMNRAQQGDAGMAEAGPARAVLLDVGGPLDTEEEWERRADAAMCAALAETTGRAVDAARLAEAGRFAVESFAPSAYKAMIWHLAGRDAGLAAQAYGVFRDRTGGGPALELRPGMADLLARLHRGGVRLGLAANQPAATLSRLAALGLGALFRHREVSGTLGVRKPDPRLFLAACAALGVEPAGCVMVGDRIDNDIAPARALGMRAVRFRTGRHRLQRPRSWEEVPEAEVDDVPGLERALERLLGEG